MSHPTISTRTWFCWLCGHCVSLEECKIDEHGMPVHDECYIVLIQWGKEEVGQKAA
jgi:hypothetical protein